MPYRVLQVKLTHHAQKRLSKRFGIKTKKAALRFAKDVVKNGEIIAGTQSLYITIVRHGSGFIFAKSLDQYGESILLMITACNDAKSSEWKCFYHGEVRKRRAIKKSKVYRGIIL
ncbi:MAG: hypothetical protein PHQ22_09625 [Sulfuricurvum sp.]|nr:hypothetical protein [Sulfuricurvum sp.]